MAAANELKQYAAETKRFRGAQEDKPMALPSIPEVLHRLRVKLYPNYLTNVPGRYIARTDDEAVLTIDQVCAAMIERGGSTAEYDDARSIVRQFFKEAARQIADGFSINMEYIKAGPAVGGTYDSAVVSDSDVHPIYVVFAMLKPLRDVLARAHVVIEGIANTTGYIDQIIDVGNGAVNETLTPGGMFTIKGYRLKIAGTDASVGIYFVPQTGGAPTKLQGNLAVNNPGELVGQVPPLADGEWKIRLVTQYSSGGTELKEPRTIESAHALTIGLT